MIVTKRIAALLATSALAATLSGCEALDFLNLSSLGLNNNEAAESTEAPAPQVTSSNPITATQPAPFDLSGAQPMMPQSTLNTQSSAANAALIGSTMGASPSGFGTMVPGVPTTTTTTATYSYGAQPNPYAPRIPSTTVTPAGTVINTAVPTQTATPTPLNAQPLLGAAQTPLAQPSVAPNLYSNPYQPLTPGATAPGVLRTPTVTPLTPGALTPASAPSPSSTTMPAQPGTLDPANLSKSTITAIQTALKSRGLYSDTVDGVWGSKSKAAMTAYLASRGESAVSLDTLFSLGVSL